MAEIQQVLKTTDVRHEKPAWATGSAPQTPATDPRDLARQAIKVYVSLRDGVSDMDWQTANAYTAIALCDVWGAQKEQYDMLVDLVRRGEKHTPHLINEFNDDTLWVRSMQI